MEVFQAISYYARVLWRGLIDTYHSIGLWTLVAAVVGIGIGLVAHIWLVRRFPNLKDKLGEPMNRWWIWIVYTLLPLWFLTILLAIYNTIMAPMRMHSELNAQKPTIGDPQDQVTIQRITRERIRAEDDRDKWKKEYEATEDERIALAEQLEEAEKQLDDREHRKKIRTDLSRWLTRIREFQKKFADDPPPSREEVVALIGEFSVYAHDNLEESHLRILASTSGETMFTVPSGPRGLDEEHRELYRHLETLKIVIVRIMGQYN